MLLLTHAQFLSPPNLLSNRSYNPSEPSSFSPCAFSLKMLLPVPAFGNMRSIRHREIHPPQNPLLQSPIHIRLLHLAHHPLSATWRGRWTGISFRPEIRLYGPGPKRGISGMGTIWWELVCCHHHPLFPVAFFNPSFELGSDSQLQCIWLMAL